MARRIGEPVVVRAEASGAPGTFLWRDRIYVVREVLGHWQERRSWWTTSVARAVHGDVESDSGAGGGGHGTLDHEREIWRVEATAGRMFGTGVYDLVSECPAITSADVSVHAAGSSASGAAAAVAPPDHRWHLLRVAD